LLIAAGPALLVVLVLGTAFALRTSLPESTNDEWLLQTRRYRAALAADSAATWRRASVPVRQGASGVRAPSRDTLSMRVAEEVARLIASAQAAGTLPQLRTPVLISARTTFSLNETSGSSTAQNAFPSINTRFIAWPEAAGDPCVASVLFAPTKESSESNELRRAASIAGPCVFVAAFGPPGARIRAWLDSVAWQAAAGPSRWLPKSQSRVGSTGRSAFASLQLFDGLDPNRPLSRFAARHILRCVDGDLDECSRALLLQGGFAFSTTQTSYAGIVWRSYWFDRAQMPMVSPSGTLVDDSATVSFGALLGDLAADLGAERFQRVWRSDLSLADAYAKETGEPFGAWAHRWMRIRPRVAAVPFGAQLPSASLWWVAAGVVASLAIVARAYRQAEFG
jgi:hypothetical protein